MAMVGEVYRHLFKKRATVLYPFRERELVNVPERMRGKPSINRDLCVGCGLCGRDCPSGAIEIVQDEKGKRPVFYLDRCLFCGQCEEICPKSAIALTPEFEIASYDRKAMILR